VHLLVIIRNKKIKNQTGNTFTRRTFHVVVSWVVRPYNLPQRERERERERETVWSYGTEVPFSRWLEDIIFIRNIGIFVKLFGSWRCVFTKPLYHRWKIETACSSKIHLPHLGHSQSSMLVQSSGYSEERGIMFFWKLCNLLPGYSESRSAELQYKSHHYEHFVCDIKREP